MNEIKKNNLTKKIEERLNTSLPITPIDPSQLQLCKEVIENTENTQFIEEYQQTLKDLADRLPLEKKEIIQPILELCQNRLKK